MKDSASDLSRLDPYDEEGILRMVVETPRGASIKLATPAQRLHQVDHVGAVLLLRGRLDRLA